MDFRLLVRWIEESMTSVLYESSWSAILIYGVFGLASFLLAWLRFRWWREVQHEESVIVFATVNFFQGFAFTGAALITAPHPVVDFRFLLPYVRLAWMVTLMLYLYGVHLVYWKLIEIERYRQGGN